MDQRTRDVDRFWTAGALDEGSNVQFGEGGAGTFSDGKLTTGTHDPRIAAVLDTLVEAGAPADVKYSHKPHVGTDVLRQVVKHIRQELIALGCDVRFGHRLEGLTIQGDALTGLRVAGPQGGYLLKADTLVLAPGHSARDTFAMLHQAGVPMEQSPLPWGCASSTFSGRSAPGSTVRHGNSSRPPIISWPATCPRAGPPSPSACARGEVVAASSAQGQVVTNGMSFRARDGKNINGGFLVGVGPEDFPAGAGPLAGVRFQEEWERAAFQAGGGGFLAPAQRVEDFFEEAALPGTGCHPAHLPPRSDLDGAGPVPARGGGGYAAGSPAPDGPEAPGLRRAGRGAHWSGDPVLLAGAHPAGRDLPVRPAGPVPCGEGAGYAGGIVSAAVDGIRVAEAVAGDKNKTRCPAGSAFLLVGRRGRSFRQTHMKGKNVSVLQSDRLIKVKDQIPVSIAAAPPEIAWNGLPILAAWSH